MAHRFGITSIIEPGADEDLMRPYLELSRQEGLFLRLRASISPINWQPGAFGDDMFDFVSKRDRFRQPGNDVESVKVYIDGVLENGSAVLLEPYSDPALKDGGIPFYSQEDTVGSITKGKRADLIVLDRNLFDMPATEINQAKVLLTLFDGQVVYNTDELSNCEKLWSDDYDE